MTRRCSHTTRAGRPCRAYAVRGSDPPACAAHAPREAGAGAPGSSGSELDPGHLSQPAGREGTLDLNAVICDLAEKQALLSTLIDECVESLDTASRGELMRLMQLHAQTASRLGRLLRDKQAIAGPGDDGFSAFINQALDDLSAEWGIDL